MKLKFLFSASCLWLGGFAHAQPFDGLTTQQREWRATAKFYDDWRSDIRNRAGSGSSAASGMPDYAAQIAQSQMQWVAGAGERRAARLREQEQARLRLQQQQKDAAENAQQNAKLRAQWEAARVRNYKSFLANGGHGTKEIPPHFYDNAQAFHWYLQQAQAGDAYGAFYVGRVHFSAGDWTQASQWLAKSDLSHPKAAAIYGYLLLRGLGVPREAERGRALLEKAAAQDTSGYAAWLYSTLLRSGEGVEADSKSAIFHLAQAIEMADQPSLLEGIDMLAPWDEPMWERKSRRSRMREELKALAADKPDSYVAAMEAATSKKLYDISGVLGGAVGEMKPEPAREVYLAWLRLAESGPTAWGYWGRVSAIGGLDRKGYPNASAHSLLPDTFHRTANSFIPHSNEQAESLWVKNAETIELWSRGTDELAPRAARALLAREMGRWPKVSSRQSPRAVLDKASALKIENLRETLSGEILDGVFTANPQWTDKEKSLQWLDQLGALDASLKSLRELYLKAPALESQFAHTLDPIVTELRKAQGGEQVFTKAQLDAAEAERNAAAKLLFSDPQAAFDGLLKALNGGDALAGWQLLVMASGKFQTILAQKQALLDLTDERLQRDVSGNDDRAATAALALHFLHNPEAVGRQWQRGWRTTRSSTNNWLQLAEQKGHPWAVFHSAEGYDASNKARNKYDADAQKIWPWLAENYAALSKTELWQRDAQLLELFPVDRDIEGLQDPLRAVEWAKTETSHYTDLISRLASARQILITYEETPAALDPAQAKALYESSLALMQLDSSYGELLPRHRVQRLELLVQSSIFGDEVAPLEVSAMLKDPGFPFPPQTEEAEQWLQIGKVRLMKIAEKGAPGSAMDAAYLLATEFKRGQLFARDEAQAVKHFALAASLGHQKAASTLNSAYKYGEMGLAKNDAEQKKWETLADQIVMGRYKIPAAVLAGRPEDPPRTD